MIESFIELDFKDKVTAVGLLFTTLLSLGTLIFSIINNQKNAYTSVILNERVTSLNNFKLNSAEFISIITNSILLEQNIKEKYFEINKLSQLICYQFNPNSYNEQRDLEEIAYLMNLIYLISVCESFDSKVNFIKSRNLFFFNKLDFNNYNNDSMNKVIEKKLLEILIVVDEILKRHIKYEWEITKKRTNKIFRS